MFSWMIIETHIWNRDSYSDTDLEKLYIIMSKQWFSVIVIKVLQRVAILLTKNKSPEFRSFVDNLWGSSEITPTWVNLQKYKLNTKIQSKMLNPFFFMWPQVVSIFYKLIESTKEVSSICCIFLYSGWVFIYFSKYRYKDALEFL